MGGCWKKIGDLPQKIDAVGAAVGTGTGGNPREEVGCLDWFRRRIEPADSPPAVDAAQKLAGGFCHQ